jgi:hypothetical protein
MKSVELRRYTFQVGKKKLISEISYEHAPSFIWTEEELDAYYLGLAEQAAREKTDKPFKLVSLVKEQVSL